MNRTIAKPADPGSSAAAADQIAYLDSMIDWEYAKMHRSHVWTHRAFYFALGMLAATVIILVMSAIRG